MKELTDTLQKERDRSKKAQAVMCMALEKEVVCCKEIEYHKKLVKENNFRIEELTSKLKTETAEKKVLGQVKTALCKQRDDQANRLKTSEMEREAPRQQVDELQETDNKLKVEMDENRLWNKRAEIKHKQALEEENEVLNEKIGDLKLLRELMIERNMELSTLLKLQMDEKAALQRDMLQGETAMSEEEQAVMPTVLEFIVDEDNSQQEEVPDSGEEDGKDGEDFQKKSKKPSFFRRCIKDLDIGQDRNWKGIGISLLVILVVLSLIGLSIVLLSRDDGNKSLGSQLTLDDLFQRNFQVHDPDAKWINEEEMIFRSWDGDVLKASVHSNETQLLLKNTTFATFKASKFAVSPDLNFVLLGYDVKQVYQHSFLASYLIYNLHTREVRELNPPEVSDSVLQFASWGVHGQQLMYIFENNIYYQTDVQSSSWRLTSSGQEGIIFNGISDWLYEEEVLHTQVAHWWSPDGSRLAYLTINDTLVPNMFLPRFTGSLYPRGKQYPYPKMGQTNPTVKLYVVTLDGSSQMTELQPPDSFEKSEYYITMVKWVTEEALAVRWVNRAQNMSILSLCNATTAECVKKHVMTSEKWLDRQNEEPVFSKDGTVFFITMPLKHGGRGAFNHITMISNQSQGQEVNLRHLTSGSWEVSQVLAYDQSTNLVYFLSTEGDATQRQLYRVSTVDPFQRECLSCSLFKPQCTYYDAILSPDYHHVLLNCRGPGIPQTTLHKLNDMNRNGILEKNAVLRDALISRTIPKRERRTVLIKNFALPLELTLPVDLDETNQHPLLLIIGSAPGGQSVSDRFVLNWDSVLVSSDKVIVARLDGRGSGFQGQRILHEVHQQLGTVEVQDHIAALEYLIRLPYIDSNKVGVYGKAYGGFLSAVLLLSYGSMFKCGIAVAPVTDWRLFGSAFTEKFFGFPAKEDRKYQISSLLSNITAPSQPDFLIIHGTADATVHFQHSAELVKLLSASNVNYTLQIFPDEGHNIASVKSQYYMLNSVITFFRQCFEEEQVHEALTAKEDD
ncbi:inactive dipeptidyl peptidase 10-like [Myripristis murdjan]|uniref:inactive dipeptidyl peptidase 10-like n=1 Tax=Myripristis murdjan TaxID=586833 RepID=UPI0011760555|nr:inactive dipeptidyl peptidase 10-like [Myripristis murdjan]